MGHIDGGPSMWQASVGDRSEFAMDIRFIPYDGGVDWDPKDMPASWGQFAMWVGGVNVCAHRTRDGKSVDTVEWYLLPVLGWLVDNWDVLLLCEDPLADEADDQERSEWNSRHCIDTAREGGIFPDLEIERVGEYVRFRCFDGGDMDVSVRADFVGTVLRTVLRRAFGWLHEQLPESCEVREWFVRSAALEAPS